LTGFSFSISEILLSLDRDERLLLDLLKKLWLLSDDSELVLERLEDDKLLLETDKLLDELELDLLDVDEWLLKEDSLLWLDSELLLTDKELLLTETDDELWLLCELKLLWLDSDELLELDTDDWLLLELSDEYDDLLTDKELLLKDEMLELENDDWLLCDDSEETLCELLLDFDPENDE